MKSKARKFISIVLLALFTLSRSLDAYATWHFSPTLKHEGNPIHIALGNSWSNIAESQVVGLLLAVFLAYRLANSSYSKESFLKKLSPLAFGKGSKTIGLRFVSGYSNDFAFLFGITLAGYVAAIFWFLAHGLELRWASRILRYEILDFPASLLATVLISFLLGHLLGRRVAAWCSDA